MSNLSQTQIQDIIQRALLEDIGSGDVTTNCIVPDKTMFRGDFIVKEDGVIGGLEVAALTFSLVDKQVTFIPKVKEGKKVKKGNIVAEVSGPARSLLTGERVALNFLQRMSGIATLTRKFADAVQGTSAVILDTRKTAPGLRFFDKWSVQLGGGQNHRFGLFDMVLIKENHITVAGSISEAVARVRAKWNKEMKIEVEVRNLTELQEALKLKVDRILLDNMTSGEIAEAVSLTKGRIPLEASGNVNLDNVAAIAATGVNFISVGKLTHSVKALDISLLLK